MFTKASIFVLASLGAFSAIASAQAMNLTESPRTPPVFAYTGSAAVTMLDPMATGSVRTAPAQDEMAYEATPRLRTVSPRVPATHPHFGS